MKKITHDGYILMLSENIGTDISDEEYRAILAAMASVPTSPSGYMYFLKNDLTWELVAKIESVTDEEVTPEEFISAMEAIL